MADSSMKGNEDIVSEQTKMLPTTDENQPTTMETSSSEAKGKPSGTLGENGGVTLRREIGLPSAIMLIVSVMIGSGIFISPSSVLEKSGSVGLCLIVWIVCGVISYIGALAFAELGAVVPESGAEYAYFQASFQHMHKFFGPLPGFIYAWVILLLVRPAEVAILCLTFSEYIHKPFTEALGIKLEPAYDDTLNKLVSLVGLGILSYINFMSVRLYVVMQNAFSSLKILACLIVIIIGLVYLFKGHTENIATGFDGTKTSTKDLALAFYGGLWAYDGWSYVVLVTEEIKSPERNILRSITIGVPLVTLLYVMMNVSYMSVLTKHEMLSAQAVATAFAQKELGSFSFIIPVAVALSTFGCAMSVQFGVSRLCYVAGRAGHMMQCLSYIHVTRLTPSPAVAMQALISAVFIASGSIVSLIEFASFLIWIFYGIAMVSLIVLRKTMPNSHRPYQVPLVVPVLLIFVSLYLALVPLIVSPAPQFLIAVAFIILGIVVYYPLVYKGIHLPFMDKITYWVQALFKVVPPDSPTKDTPAPATQNKGVQIMDDKTVFYKE